MTLREKVKQFRETFGYDDSAILACIIKAEEEVRDGNYSCWRGSCGEEGVLPPAGNTCGPFTAFLEYFCSDHFGDEH